MLDDHVYSRYDCQTAKNVFISACAELSGSVVVGEKVWIRPQFSIMNKAKIGMSAYTGLGEFVIKTFSTKLFL